MSHQVERPVEPGESQLRRLADRARIAAIGLRNATALDRRDAQLLCSCFAPDALLLIDKVGVFEGHEAIAGSLTTLSALDATQHVVTNPIIGIAGDEATMTSSFVAAHVKHDHPAGPLFTVGGSYADELSRVGGEWLIVRRAVGLVWSTGNAAMLLKAHR